MGADVGQGQREEVDTPIVNGGNYGWRVFEGRLHRNDPALCNPANYIFPIFDYPHSSGRCSIPADMCIGKPGRSIGNVHLRRFLLRRDLRMERHTQSVLLDTAMSISSFGEDEQGEIYVVDLGGTVSRIVPTAPCTYSISPTRAEHSRARAAAPAWP